jgi:3-oxoacyl-[acyl-carrier protein] reductase
MRLLNKVALITGGGMGMGKAIALAFAGEGADVVVNDIQYEKAQGVAKAILSSGRQAFSNGADVRNRQAVDALVKEAVDRFGKIDILVNCAGILLVKKFVETTDQEWGRILDVNLTGTFYCSRAVLAQSMLSRKSGKIINFASITPIKGDENVSAYAASKGAIMGLTKALSKEVGRSGIQVNAIAPGYIDTDQTKEFFVDNLREHLKKLSVFKRIGAPDDIIGIAVFLASEESSYMTGQTVVVDGGVV